MARSTVNPRILALATLSAVVGATGCGPLMLPTAMPCPAPVLLTELQDAGETLELLGLHETLSRRAIAGLVVPVANLQAVAAFRDELDLLDDIDDSSTHDIRSLTISALLSCSPLTNAI